MFCVNIDIDLNVFILRTNYFNNISIIFINPV